MIRCYCQYSYGGFKTFRIKGEAHEALTQEVKAENSYGFPKLADLYFNQGGAKILYRYLDKNTLALIIREIPGPGLDTDNRQINCAIQFIGDAKDRKQMDRLAIKLINNLKKFETDFADMFDMRGGLYFDGDKLNNIVKESEAECQYEGESKLLQIRNRQGVVLLFVPFSANFGTDPKVTEKMLSELHLPEEATETDRLMSLLELKKIQNFIEVKPINKDVQIDTNYKDNTKTNGFGELIEKLETKEKELEEKKQECSHLRSEAVKATKENESLKREFNEWKDKMKLIIMVGGGILGLSLLTNIINFFFKER